jgi:hypothetical protein
VVWWLRSSQHEGGGFWTIDTEFTKGKAAEEQAEYGPGSEVWLLPSPGTPPAPVGGGLVQAAMDAAAAIRSWACDSSVRGAMRVSLNANADALETALRELSEKGVQP